VGPGASPFWEPPPKKDLISGGMLYCLTALARLSPTVEYSERWSKDERAKSIRMEVQKEYPGPTLSLLTTCEEVTPKSFLVCRHCHGDAPTLATKNWPQMMMQTRQTHQEDAKPALHTAANSKLAELASLKQLYDGKTSINKSCLLNDYRSGRQIHVSSYPPKRKQPQKFPQRQCKRACQIPER
jgi:hypothetical protein